MDADLLPSPILVTDSRGIVLSINANFLQAAGGDRLAWLGQPMDGLFPLASRIFLQTHIWPMLLRDGQVREVRLQIRHVDKEPLPVFGNCQRHTVAGVDQYHWLFFATYERTRYEAELLEARKRADTVATRYAQGEKFLRSLTDAIPSLIAYWDCDLHCRFSNQSYFEWFGKSTAQMQGIHLQALLGDALFALNAPHIQGALAGTPQEFERQIIRPDGTVGVTLVQYIPDREPGGVTLGFFAVVTNVTRLREADAAIRLSASVFNATSEGIMVTDAQGLVLSVNPAFSQISGYAEEAVLGQTPRMFQSERHTDEFYRSLLRTLLDTGQWKGDVWCQRADGTACLNAITVNSIRDDYERVVRYVGVCTDVSERHKRDELIRHTALHDGLTDLPNRTLMMERLNQLMAVAAREPRPVAVLFLDLDGFKAVNDVHGHETGDLVLKQVAERLKDLLRTSDTVARLGGDEFVILLLSPESKEAVAQIAARTVSAIKEPMAVGGRVAQVGVSIGIAMHPEDGANAQMLLKCADLAMYQAKSAGKNTFRFYE